MDYNALAALIQTHPQWPTVADADLVTWLDEVVRNDNKASLPNEEILAVIITNRAEFTALADGDKQIVRDILYIGDSVPTAAGEPARDTLVAIFGAQSNTIQSLAEAISYPVSRAEAVGIVGEISVSDVAYARGKV
jgi:hypothetical protein